MESPAGRDFRGGFGDQMRRKKRTKVFIETEVEKALQLKADGFIPSDIIVPRTVNRGIPAVIDAPKSEVARSFERLAEHFTARPAAARRR